VPLIQIKSLPLEGGLSISSILEGISRDFSEQVGIEIKQVMITWEELPSWCYAIGGRTTPNQPKDSHPILVDLLVLDFNPPDRVEKMLRCVASIIAKWIGIQENNVFINVRAARSGQVLDAGEIVRW
jgi:hypothetical protein